jgi:hypothetical protein
MEPMPVVDPPLEPVKRKRDAFDLVSDEIKKFRITVSPGEIRLQKDVAELGQPPGIELSPADRASAVIVRFVDHRAGASPSLFLVAVGKFYPHQAPRIHCLEQGYASPLVREDGFVTHPFFGRDWMPMYTLGDMIGVLHRIRMMYTGEVDQDVEYEPEDTQTPTARSPRQPAEHSPRHHVVEDEDEVGDDGGQHHHHNEGDDGECQMELPRVSSFNSTSSPF